MNATAGNGTSSEEEEAVDHLHVACCSSITIMVINHHVVDQHLDVHHNYNDHIHDQHLDVHPSQLHMYDPGD